MGGSSGPDEVTNTMVSEPPEWLVPHLQGFINQGLGLANQPYEAYTGQRIAEFTPQHDTAFQMIQDRALEGSPYMDTAQATGIGMMGNGGMNSGGYGVSSGGGAHTAENQYIGGLRDIDSLSVRDNRYLGDNPYVQSMIDQTSGDVMENYRDSVYRTRQ